MKSGGLRAPTLDVRPTLVEVAVEHATREVDRRRLVALELDEVEMPEAQPRREREHRGERQEFPRSAHAAFYHGPRGLMGERGSPMLSGEGGIRTLDGGLDPHNALAGRRLQPLGHFSGASGW